MKYYKKKYGRTPNLCLIHPNALDSPVTEDGISEKSKTEKTTRSVNKENGVIIRPYRPVLPGHLWIGVEEKN